MVAYPWIASAVTRSPLLIAAAGFASLSGSFKPIESDEPREKINFKAEIKEGFAGYGHIHFCVLWQVVWIVTAFQTLFAVLWNTITVSLRQSIIPTHLLGRVNSVYRFFAWGSIPIGILLGGGLVTVLAHFLSRESALRAPFFASTVLGFVLLALAAPHLTTAKIDASRVKSES